MKTVFDPAVRDELIGRINSLNENSVAQWGKMNIHQMLKHCIIWDEWVLGTHKVEYKQSFLGKIFGKMALKSSVKDDKPLKKNMPADRLAVKDAPKDVERQKRVWMERIASYNHYSNPAFVHGFFGKMSTEQIGVFAYKHSDHHLRQFGC